MIAVSLPEAATYEAWRDKARPLLSAGVSPERISWSSENTLALFAEGMAEPGEMTISVPRAFVDTARKAILNSEPERFALLYRVLWRLQSNRTLMDDATDADITRLRELAKAVRRDEHKMHAFVRFKEVTEDDDTVRMIAWFEPRHHILAETADFFVRRFTGMRWSIITPEASAHWDGDQLRMGMGGVRSDVPAEDARDEDWRIYYRSMFNPARLKVTAMKREMPKRYWKNMPETREIADLVAGASARTTDMVAASPTAPRKRAGAAHTLIAPRKVLIEEARIAARGAAPSSLHDLNAALSACRACDRWKPATQVVPGEGKADRPLLAFVGEQPGDQEDLAGRAFVGPAGQLLDRALADAGIARSQSYLTNAVKHFKFEPRGKRRIHSRANAGEVEICRWWVQHELALVRPVVTIALGATAAASLARHKGPLHAVRGRLVATREGAPLFVTVHPSFLLRLPDESARTSEYARFVSELAEAKALAEDVAARAEVSLEKQPS